MKVNEENGRTPRQQTRAGISKAIWGYYRPSFTYGDQDLRRSHSQMTIQYFMVPIVIYQSPKQTQKTKHILQSGKP